LVFGAYHKSTKIDSLIADSLLQIIRYDRGQLRTKQFYFVKNYANSYVGFFILKTKMATDFFANADTLLNLFNQLKEEFKHTEEGEWLLKKIKNKLGIRIGQQINNFSFRNNQDEFTVSDSFLGKRPILLCFWASWCKPCIKKIPEIKNIYEAYAGKGLEIISISIDKTSEEWKKAIIKYDLNWLQAIDGSTNYLGKNIASVFDIEAVPQYFLIDKDKKIIYHNIKVKENEELDKLKEILRNIFFEK
jgi:peroxiredoxin